MIKSMDYNLISIGDHCAIPMLLNDLHLRTVSYPFDWVSKTEQLHDTNIMYHLDILHQLTQTADVGEIVRTYLGDAFDKSDKTNTTTQLWFPHDGEPVHDIVEKYTRRFLRLKEDLPKKNMFFLLTRHYYIEEATFQKIMDQLLSYHPESILVFISGTNHLYFEKMYPRVIFQYMDYDITKFYEYDYTTFRPKIKDFLKKLLE